MTHLLLVRHGETDWNIQCRHQGQKDIPLNALGRQQIAAVAHRLAGESLDTVYASDLSRAWETAVAITAQHDDLAIIKEPRLREMHFGEWEGLTYDEIQQRKPMTPDEYTQMLSGDGPPGGENLPQFAARIQKVINDLVNNHPDDIVLLVAHSGTLMVLTCLLLPHPVENYWQFPMDRASVSKISIYPEGAILTLLNDTSHLKGIIS